MRTLFILAAIYCALFSENVISAKSNLRIYFDLPRDNRIKHLEIRANGEMLQFDSLNQAKIEIPNRKDLKLNAPGKEIIIPFQYLDDSSRIRVVYDSIWEEPHGYNFFATVTPYDGTRQINANQKNTYVSFSFYPSDENQFSECQDIIFEGGGHEGQVKFTIRSRLKVTEKWSYNPSSGLVKGHKFKPVAKNTKASIKNETQQFKAKFLVLPKYPYIRVSGYLTKENIEFNVIYGGRPPVYE